MSFFIVLIAIAQTADGPSHPVTATGALDFREIPLHRVARYQVTVEGPSGATLALAPWEEALPGLEATFGAPILSTLPGGRQTLVQEIRLAPIYARPYALPPVVVLLDGAAVATLEPGELAVRPLTPEEEAGAATLEELVTLAELEGTGGTPLGPWLATGAVVVTVLLLTSILYWRKKGVLWRPRTRPRNPLEEALYRLDALASGVEDTSVSREAVYVGLSSIVRSYLEDAYGMPVLECSTPELLEGPMSEIPLEPALHDALRALLVESDRVKFAQLERNREEQREAIAAARELVTHLDQPPVPAADERGAA